MKLEATVWSILQMLEYYEEFEVVASKILTGSCWKKAITI